MGSAQRMATEVKLPRIDNRQFGISNIAGNIDLPMNGNISSCNGRTDGDPIVALNLDIGG